MLSLQSCFQPTDSPQQPLVTAMSLEGVLSTPTQGGGLKRPADPEEVTNKEKHFHQDTTGDADSAETVRRKRRKYALLLSYSGKGYLGMQRNPGYRTIEDDLLTAMLRADLMTEEGCTCPQMFHFQRAARTDKGVSAARQVVSVKLPEDVPDMVEKINEHLCSQIRVMAIRRATKGFNCKSWCDSRTYSYMCPTFAFSPKMEMTAEDYRITPEVLGRLKDILKLYKGTHNFHNFTARKKAQDASANRYIMDIDCGQPFEREGLEWVIIKIKGQSFMLHQIRKMVGLAMAISRGLVGPEVITKAWRKTRLDVPIAPGLGLVLEEPHYDKYNKRYGSDGIHEPLAWEDEKQKIQEFREQHIDSSIIKTEIKDKSMLQWLTTLPLHHFSVSEASLPMKATPRPMLGRQYNKGSEDEAEDEDEGDLDQYRVYPEKRKEESAATESRQCQEETNGHLATSIEEIQNANTDLEKQTDSEGATVLKSVECLDSQVTDEIIN